MEFLERITQPRAGWLWGGIPGLGVVIAVIGFGAPPWVLIPVWWTTMVAHSHLIWYVKRKTGRPPFDKPQSG